MTILEALIQLRDDLKLWCINNFNHKLNKNLGTEESGKVLSVDSNGDIVTTSLGSAAYTASTAYDAAGTAQTKANAALASAKSYAESLVEGLTSDGTADAGVVQAALDAHTGNTSNPHNVTLAQLGVNATATELNYVDGVTSSIQTQINGKAASSHGHAIADVTGLQSALDKKAGMIVTGQSFTLSDGTAVTAGEGAEVFNSYSSLFANKATGNYSHAEGASTTASALASHAEGYSTFASGKYSHAEGYHNTTASGEASHAEGYGTTASGNHSHAEGESTTASGQASHAEGGSTTASGNHSHAEGRYTDASGLVSHAEGYHTTALDYQHAQGRYNNTTNATAGNFSGTGTGTAFVIGNGSGDSSLSNAFRVTYDGQPYAKSSLTTTGCDYAEFFEWQDLNPNAEDRRGYFVTLDGDKIKIAEPNDYILGIISGQPSVLGNGDEDWMGRYVFDEFGAFVYEDFEYEVDGITKTGKRYKENPNYDPSIPYIQRGDRQEWDAVGMLGVLSVRDDGTCKVNGYCKVASGGIATASETGYRVIKRVNDNIVKVIFR